MSTWHNDRIVWGPVLVARCVKWALHVHVFDESVNEVVIIVTRCIKHNWQFWIEAAPLPGKTSQVYDLSINTI